jgi:DNA-directed RNA polymerase specialized sigma24 family protein
MEVLELPVARKLLSDAEVTRIYENCFPLVARFVNRMQGSYEDAKDIFHDALVIYIEKASEETFQINVAEEAYILGIAKHLWLRKNKDSYAQLSLDKFEACISLPEDEGEPNITKLLNFLERFGKSCLNLLSAFYAERKSAKQVAEEFGYSTIHSATVQKYKCLEKVRNTVKEKSLRYDDFTSGD